MRLALLLALAAAALSGCTSPRESAAPPLDGSVWREVCPGSDPEVSYIELRPGGVFAWSYDGPSAFTLDPGETWSAEGGTLTVSWNDGFAVTRYRMAPGATTLAGVSTKSCGDRARLERVR
jgi:hypothetical protein